MFKYDMHIHTEYCGHAAGMTIPAIIKRAEELGLETIAITDHILSHDRLPVIDRIRQDAAEIKTACRVIIGAEIDCDGKYWDGRLVTDKLDGIDYVVGAVHYVPGIGNYPLSPADNPLEPDVILDRWRSTLFGLLANPNIDTLAHPGRMIASSIDLDVFFEDILAVFAEAAQISAKNNVAWELNELNGSKIPPGFKTQWHRIYQLAVRAGVKLIYGSDAHKPQDIGSTAFVQTILKELPANCLQTPCFTKVKSKRI